MKKLEPKFITLTQVKQQCRLDADDTSEDALLQIYAAAAEQTVFSMINRSELEALDEFGFEMPAPIIAAMLILTAQSYKYREASSPEAINKVPYGVQCMIAPYVKLTDLQYD